MKSLGPTLTRLASLAVSAVMAVTLWEGARAAWSRRRRRHIPSIPDARGAVLTGTMDGGWVTLLGESDERTLGRGRLMLRRTPQRASNESFWEGEIRSLRLEGEAATLTPGPYRVQLDQSGEIQPIHINDVVLSENAVSAVLISWLEPDPPATLTELGGH